MSQGGEFVKMQRGWMTSPQLYGLGGAVKLLYAACIDDCAMHWTDGFVSAKKVPLLLAAIELDGANESLFEVMQNANLLTPVEGGWQINNYEKWQITASKRAEISSKRSQAAAARWGTPQKKTVGRKRANANAMQSVCKPDANENGLHEHVDAREEKRREENIKTKAKSNPLLDSIVAAWNANCSPLPRLRKAPPSLGDERALLGALEYFDGDEEKLGRAFARAAKDAYYRESGHGCVTVCRHISRWDGAEPKVALMPPEWEDNPGNPWRVAQ